MKGVSTQEIMKIALRLSGWTNIPADSAIHVSGTNIKKVFVSIDVNPSDITLAKSLGCDCILTHHPIGKSLINFHKVFQRHVEYMISKGIEEQYANTLVKSLMEKVEVKTNSYIYNDVVSTAKLLKMPLLNIHQPVDEYMRQVILKTLRGAKLKKVSDLIKAIEQIPEFEYSQTRISVYNGKSTNRLGDWMLVIAAGSNGGYEIAKTYFEKGISTVIYLHIDYNELIKLRKDNKNWNLVVLGHLAGDSIGMNALCKELEKLNISVIKRGLIST